MGRSARAETECISLFGERISIPTDRLSFRPSVYAVVTQKDSVLLVRTEATGKFSFPGGGVCLGEQLKEALLREVREEVSIDVEIGELLHVEEAFFYYDPAGRAMHTLGFFFRCFPTHLNLTDKQIWGFGMRANGLPRNGQTLPHYRKVIFKEQWVKWFHYSNQNGLSIRYK